MPEVPRISTLCLHCRTFRRPQPGRALLSWALYKHRNEGIQEMNWQVLIKQIKSLSCRGHMSLTHSKKTFPARSQNWLLGELFQCPRCTRSSSEPDSSNAQSRSECWATVLGAPRESQPSPPRLGQHPSHTGPQGRELPASQLSSRNQQHLPKAAGCRQAMREHATARLQTQGCASSNKGAPSPTANFHTDEVRKENKRRDCILEKWKHLLKDFLKAMPHLLKATPETPAAQQLAIHAGNSKLPGRAGRRCYRCQAIRARDDGEQFSEAILCWQCLWKSWQGREVILAGDGV